MAAALAPREAEAERPPCSSPDHAPDLLLRLQRSGSARAFCSGTSTPSTRTTPTARSSKTDGRLFGSGAIDMKGGDVLALAVLRALVEQRERFAEVALLLVGDEEWRTHPFAHTGRFAGWNACLCFEAGERLDGDEAVVVRRKAAGTLRVTAHGRAAHSGSAPDKGANALLALAAAHG